MLYEYKKNMIYYTIAFKIRNLSLYSFISFFKNDESKKVASSFKSR